MPIVIEASQMAVNSKFVLGWHGTYCRMQIIGLGFVVKYTYVRGQVTKSENMPRPDEDNLSRPRPRPRTKFRPPGQSGLEDLTSLSAKAYNLRPLTTTLKAYYLPSVYRAGQT